MAVRNIVLMGNPSLRGVAAPVDDPTAPEIASLAKDMRDTLEEIDGVGLAAPQIEVAKRVVIYRVPDFRIPAGAKMRPVPWTVMVNPVIESLSDEKKPIWERCLSLPGLYGRVPRYVHITISFQTMDGQREEREARGYHAMLLQHECDHLDGYLYPMRMTDMSQLSFVSELVDDGDIFDYPADDFGG
jgi:peptide deformylase